MIDRQRTWSWLDSPAAQDRPYGLSNGEHALFFGMLFFFTAGVAMWASTLPQIGAFFLGMGWTLVLVAAGDWERKFDRRAVTVVDAPPSAMTTERRVLLHEYRANHDIRDLATLPCRYGCTDPTTCRAAHAGCSHCRAIRAKAAAGGADGR